MTTASEQVQASPAVDPYRFGWRYVQRPDENGQPQWVRVPLTYEDILHPQEDDFVVHHFAHQVDCPYLKHALNCAVHGREGALVLFDVRIDWGVEGVEPLGPDLIVFFGGRPPEKLLIGTYKPKEYGASPALVIEVTSPSTRGNDLNGKVVEYFRAGVPFYAIVDYLPEADLERAVLLGFRATPQGYVRVPLDERGRLWLEPIAAWLAWEDGRTVCYDADNQRIADGVELRRELRQVESRNEELQSITEEAITARHEAERKATDEARQREEAEKRATDEARQREEAEQRATDEARQRDEAEKRATDEARQREEAEKRASDLAGRMADLEAELRRWRGGP